MSGGSQVTVLAAAAAAADVLCPWMPSLQSIAQKKLMPNAPHITTAESMHCCRWMPTHKVLLTGCRQDTTPDFCLDFLSLAVEQVCQSKHDQSLPC